MPLIDLFRKQGTVSDHADVRMLIHSLHCSAAKHNHAWYCTSQQSRLHTINPSAGGVVHQVLAYSVWLSRYSNGLPLHIRSERGTDLGVQDGRMGDAGG